MTNLQHCLTCFNNRSDPTFRNWAHQAPYGCSLQQATTASLQDFQVNKFLLRNSKLLVQIADAHQNSLWRPQLPVIEAYPLAACLYTSTVPADLVPLDVVYPHYAEESLEIIHSPSHQWFYKSAMTPEDIMLIKLFDNEMEHDTAFCEFLSLEIK